MQDSTKKELGLFGSHISFADEPDVVWVNVKRYRSQGRFVMYVRDGNKLERSTPLRTRSVLDFLLAVMLQHQAMLQLILQLVG